MMGDSTISQEDEEIYRSTGLRILEQWYWIDDSDGTYSAAKLVSCMFHFIGSLVSFA